MTDLRTLKAGSGTVATDIFNAVIDAILGGLRFTASNVDSGAATDGQVLTADGAGGASWEAGGGSQPFAVAMEQVVIEYADFIPLEGGAFFAPARTLQVGETYILGGFICTEATDDSSSPDSLGIQLLDQGNAEYFQQPQDGGNGSASNVDSLGMSSIYNDKDDQGSGWGGLGSGAQNLNVGVVRDAPVVIGLYSGSLVGDGNTGSWTVFMMIGAAS